MEVDGAVAERARSALERFGAGVRVIHGDGHDDDEARVWQSGPRRLWSEAEAAHRWWENEGRPGHDRFGLTVTAEGQAAWLDTPNRSWPV
ncbi:hypothetical protein GCM10010387_02330 [Streptomyces inusitatus]|uniref:Uncharacterized protein n=1 Tax=Streptomyces inusitatus TaxID=68221 RepID=A0A918PK37_9ACTN|nr:hypothetical protein GCM10010387_02330 [Streptomyces inusitatus]